MKFSSYLCAVALLISGSVYSETRDQLNLVWEDLIPEGTQIKNPLDTLTDEEYNALTDDEYQALWEDYQEQYWESYANAPVVPELDKKEVTLSGYAVVLDYDAETVYEFLLVPYFGACIHVPPPPSNQIVHVTHESGTKLEGMWDPISVTGMMNTKQISTELADAGYQIQATDISPYELNSSD